MKSQINFLLIFCCFLVVSCTKKMSTSTASASTETPSAVSTPSAKTSLSPGVISFAAANDRYSANGVFKKWKFTKIDMQKNKIESLNAQIEIDLSSISEKSAKLTEHLKAWDYFDVEKYTTAQLTISNVRPKGNSYIASLELKMRDAVQKMESEFELVGENPMRVKGKAMVDRGLFKIAVDNKKVPNMIEVSYDAALVE